MDENKNELLEGVEDAEETNEVIEETEEIEEIAEETETEETEDNKEAEKYISKDLLLDEVIELRTVNKALKKKNCAKTVALSIIGAVIAVIIVACSVTAIFNASYNPYNHMGYSNFTGETIASIAEAEGISVKEVLNAYDLPNDMRGDTYWDVVTYMTPLYTMERNYQMSVEEIIAYFGFSDEVTREWTLGEAYDTLTISKIVGEGEAFATFVEEYGLDASVTPETLWGDVRKQVDKVDYEKYMAEQATEAVESLTEEVVEELTELIEAE